jgi:hypothetical protein
MVSAGFIYLSTASVVEPVELISGFRKKILNVESFTGIKVKKGAWDIKVNRSDTFSVSVRGGDNIIDNYIDAHVMDDILILDLSPDIKSQQSIYLSVDVNIPYLNFIEGSNAGRYTINNLNQEEFKVNIKNFCSVLMDSCSISQLSVECSGISSLKGFNGIIEFVEGELKDSSYVYLSNLKNDSKIELSDMAVFFSFSPEGKRTIRLAEKIKECSTKMTSYIEGLKWMMPFHTVIKFAKEKQIIHDEYFRDSLLLAEHGYSYWLSQNILKINLNSYNNYDLNNSQLIISRGLLSDISLSFDKKYCFDSEYYEQIRQSLIDQFGKPNAKSKPLIMDGKKDRIINTAWNIKEEMAGDFYTRIELYFVKDKFMMLHFAGPLSTIDKIPRLLFDTSTTFKMDFQRRFNNTIVGKFYSQGIWEIN